MENENNIWDIEYEYEYEAINAFVDYAKNGSKCPFKVGDIVKLKNGEAPQRVAIITQHNKSMVCEYLTSRKQNKSRSWDDFELYTEVENKVKEEKTMKVDLYRVIETGRFGDHIATDTNGDYVLKMQDTGAYEGHDVSKLKRVIPYTFEVQFSGSGKRYAYRGKEGQVEVGDVLLLDNETNSLAVVTAVNTESDAATKTFVGRKVLTERIG